LRLPVARVVQSAAAVPCQPSEPRFVRACARGRPRYAAASSRWTTCCLAAVHALCRALLPLCLVPLPFFFNLPPTRLHPLLVVRAALLCCPARRHRRTLLGVDLHDSSTLHQAFRSLRQSLGARVAASGRPSPRLNPLAPLVCSLPGSTAARAQCRRPVV
jgi:hypothetical protein